MALILFFVAILWVSMVGAQPVAGTACMSHTASATSVSYPCTIAAHSNRLVVLGIVADPSVTPTNVLFGGAAVTAVTSAGTGYTIWMYQQINPSTGSQNLSYDGMSSFPTTGMTAPFTNAHQTTPLDTAATAGGGAASSTSVSVTSATGDLVMDMAFACCMDCFATPWTVGATQTMLIREMNGSWGPTGMSTKAGAGTPVSMSWDCSGGWTDGWGAIGVSINAAPTAATLQPRRRVQ
jgi:hypothetical protein